MKEKIIKSFEDFVEYTENYKNRFLFRGQANKYWLIIPSIFRKNDDLKNEVYTLKNAIKDSNSSILSTLFKMQHHGTPTRLLDLTISPLSALFFAIEDSTQANNDGVVYVIDKTKTFSLNSKEIHLFSEALIKQDINDLEYSSIFSEQDVKSILTKDYIIKYDYNFSYTNQRAILQGGTALLFGFDFLENKFRRKSNRTIDHLIFERIIIPSELKMNIKEKLEQLGYSKNILYGAFESEDGNKEIEISNSEFDTKNSIGFYKIIAKYKLNNILFNKDDLFLKIEDIYKKLFIKYGDNARIWLYFYYDEYDLTNGNWICRTQWNETYQYKIIWTKDYYLNRLRYMNEEISSEELRNYFAPKVKIAKEINQKVEDIVSIDKYDIKRLINTMLQYKSAIRKIFLEVSDIGKGNTEIEKYAQSAEQYICDVDSLLDELGFGK